MIMQHWNVLSVATWLMPDDTTSLQNIARILLGCGMVFAADILGTVVPGSFLVVKR